ncbi:MAG: hypothetical protein H9789_10925 [Candidatus Paraprevotella stercoravium]|jgi:hypothetical protein|uniref:Uncharacterized protein n=2 Tax=Bacteroidales TaxID=171549 RepID=A0ABT7U454_9BACE|nr:hypothetical protein [Candidatus Paraprevotella stercoravium]MDM8145307.1 hypothetical protein [Bacteroides eggerthii]
MEQKLPKLNNSKIYTLDLIREEKRQVRKQIQESSDRIRNTYQNMVAPPKQPTTKMETFMNAFDQGMAIYDGIMMGMRIVRSIRSIFGSSRKKKRW